mgnify:CR=1 FL=1
MKNDNLSAEALKISSRNQKVPDALLTPEGENLQGFGSSLFTNEDNSQDVNDTYIICCLAACGGGGSSITTSNK